MPPFTLQSRRDAFLSFGLVLLLALISVLGTLRIQREATRWVSHTQEVRERIDRTLWLLADAERAQRGYLLTSDKRFLKPYSLALAAIPDTLDNLQQLTVDSEVQQRALVAVRSEVHDKLAELAETIALQDSGQAASALSIVNSGRGVAIMDRLRTELARMRTAEDDLLRQRSARATEANTWTVAAVVAMGTMAVLLLWLLRTLMARDAARIRESEQRLATTVASIGDAVIATDAEGNVERMNPVAEELTGWPLAEARGKPLDTVFHIISEHTREGAESPHHKVLREGKVVGLANHTLLIRKDGTESPIEDSGAPIRGADGTIAGTVLVFKDASERYAAERALAASEARFRGTFENAAVGIAQVGLDGRFLKVNDAFLAISGYTSELLEQRTIRDVAHPEDRDAEDSQAQALTRGEISHYSTEKRYLRADGTPVCVCLTVGLQRDGNGEPQYYISIVEDITLRRRAEQAQRESEDRFRAAVGAIEGVLWTNSAEGEMRGEQPSWAALTGQSIEEYQGYGWSRAIHPDDAQPTLDAWNGAVAKRVPFKFEHRVRRHDGVWRTFSVRAIPILDERGEIREWVGVHTDITEERVALASLKEADQRKNEFLATLAHELRNPVAPIRHAIAILDKEQVAEEQQRWSRGVIARQVNHMARLLDDLLDSARITRGELLLQPAPVELKSVVTEALDVARPIIERKGHALEVILPEQPITLMVDGIRISQVLSNLLTNAAKYTDSGGTIVVKAELGTEQLLISVKDSGVGLSTESLPHVFKMFRQVRSVRDRSEGGLGIGLSLANELIKLHGGRIEVMSAGEGQGSVFLVALPISIATIESVPVSATAQAPRTNASRLILIIDDNVDAAASLGMLLELSGNEVLLAHSGEEGILVARQHRPTAIIIDIGLPGMDGYQVAQELRQEPWGRHVRLIALTGWGQTRDKEAAAAAGFDYHLTKPADADEVHQLIATG